MHKLSIQTPEFIRLELAFKRWLQALNFEPTTINYNPVRIREFFYWLERNQIQSINQINKPILLKYFTYLRQRRNQCKAGKLSKNTLRTHQQSLRRFARYLRETEQDSFDVDIQFYGTSQNIKHIFTRSEIDALYDACDSDILGLRDRAMISVYYGCGLRRNEGISLDLGDIFMERKLLHVRRGKNYKERYVPLSNGVYEDLLNYIRLSRPMLLQFPVKALFLGVQGKRLSGNSMFERLKALRLKAEIDKQAGLHSLRHSIATHLLESGMELHQIRRFLGHSSLESTQIYTHINHD